ncbi:VOC family protein [Metabacillus arenae]|uniref:VOC family protein n=1 Tax=Metabacillus arenae TaxID=2771434 RepID=A0A926NJM5_9BACI|nr:VOC family protein [Metabacillus arenae]MBD1381990.1 VOC family protein [Metabacillus arenae]
MYTSIHHVSLIVTDLERSKHFYGNVLGFEEIERPNFDTKGAWYQLGNTQLHLIVYDEGKTLRGTIELDSQDGHFAVRVTDIDAFIKRMEEQNISMLTIPSNAAGWHQVYVSDPDGNLIEFNYYAEK